MSNNETIGKIRYQLEIDIDDNKFKNLLKASMVEVHKVSILLIECNFKIFNV
jgi:hypothetical protein